MSATQTKLTRADSARINGAKGKGPVTQEGKSRCSQNAVKHGLSSAKWLRLPGESEDAYQEFREAVLEDLAPEGALQRIYSDQIVDILWRLRRMVRMEAHLVDQTKKEVANYARYDWPQSHAALARYEATLYRNLDKARKALDDLQNKPKAIDADANSKLQNEPKARATNHVQRLCPEPANKKAPRNAHLIPCCPVNHSAGESNQLMKPLNPNRPNIAPIVAMKEASGNPQAQNGRELYVRSFTLKPEI